MRRTSFAMIGAVLATTVFVTAANAEGDESKGGKITVTPVTITLRAPRPQAATEISKVLPVRPLAPLRQPFLDRIEKSIDKAPF